MKITLHLITFMLLAFSIGAMAQTVTGTVTDSYNGSTMPRVNLVVKGASVGTTTDFDGKYEIEDIIGYFSFYKNIKL